MLYRHVVVSLCVGILMASCATGGGDVDPDAMAGGPPLEDAAVVMDAGMTGSGNCSMTCPTGTICRGFSCVSQCSAEGTCEGNRECCEGACVNLQNSTFDCGSCGTRCDGDSNVCTAGECRCGTSAPCESGTDCCGGSCVNLQSNTMHCGGCGLACAAGEVCSAGMCEEPPCSPACAEGEACVDGACQCGMGATCASDQACCGDACVNVTSDAIHCGACDNACAADEVCLDGSCSRDVPCEPECAAGETCVRGECRCGSSPACTGSTTCCEGSCRDLQSDTLACGACGRSCGGSESCCSGSCVDTSSSFSNCGGCGSACDSMRSDRCSGGSCYCGSETECLVICVPPLGCIL